MIKKKLLILKDKIKRKSFLKNELKMLILKSIFRNFRVKESVRINSKKKITFLQRKSFLSKQNNICLLSGRNGGVYKKWQISRHNMKMLSKLSLLTNVKINSW